MLLSFKMLSTQPLNPYIDFIPYEASVLRPSSSHIQHIGAPQRRAETVT